jgi:hypothetical protein
VREFYLPTSTYYVCLAEQCRFFIEKFGREPNADDPIFFDPAADTPQILTMERAEELFNEAVEDMAKTEKRPDLAYAAKKTGVLMRASLEHLFPPSMLKEWEDARREYFAANTVQ